MDITLKKGNGILALTATLNGQISVLQPCLLPQDLNEEEIIKKSFDNPVNCLRLRKMIRQGESVVIVTSDNTRPLPSKRILPVLLNALYEAGVRKEDITILFARGSHRNMTKQEAEELVGKEIYDEIKCDDSDWEHVNCVGTTKRGTKVCIDQRVTDADHVICIGNVEYHYFAGYSGGAKAIFPGMSTPECIAMNHAHMVEDHACAAVLEGNPVREDLEEACAFVKVDAILNVVLNTKKQIIASYFGDVKQAHREACAYYDSVYRAEIEEKADIVIVSQGGAPKDRNLYQTQKALDNASHALKDGGTMIVVGSCNEGFGQKTFEEWMLKYKDPYEMTDALKKHFALGAHKACAIANIRKKADIFLVSDMDEKVVEKTFLRPFESLQEAFDTCIQKYGTEAKLIVMPYGGSTLPRLKKQDILG